MASSKKSSTSKSTPRLEVKKTFKLFINGAFPRSESGRVYEVVSNKSGFIANPCLASRKDLRDAVVAARAAQSGWAPYSDWSCLLCAKNTSHSELTSCEQAAKTAVMSAGSMASKSTAKITAIPFSACCSAEVIPNRGPWSSVES